jgi:hypothetical protein
MHTRQGGERPRVTPGRMTGTTSSGDGPGRGDGGPRGSDAGHGKVKDPPPDDGEDSASGLSQGRGPSEYRAESAFVTAAHGWTGDTTAAQAEVSARPLVAAVKKF